MKKILSKKTIYILSAVLLIFLFFRVGFLSKFTLRFLDFLSESTLVKSKAYTDIESKLQQLPLGISRKEVIQKMKPHSPTITIDERGIEYWYFSCPTAAATFNECVFDSNSSTLTFVSTRGDYYKRYNK